jgi:hypothetical protein
MADNVGVFTKLDQLLPAEKMRDSKARVVRQENPRKKRSDKPREGFRMERVQQEEGGPIEPSKDQHPGKILDIVV